MISHAYAVIKGTIIVRGADNDAYDKKLVFLKMHHLLVAFQKIFA